MNCLSEQITSAESLILWAAKEYDNLAMTSAFGLSGVVLIDLVQNLHLRVPVLFVDTGFMFPETLQTRDRLLAKYPELVVLTLHPGQGAPEPMSAHCCDQRKVQPMRRALTVLRPDALLSGRGRFQAVTRRDLVPVERDRDPVRVNPLVSWTSSQIEEYAHLGDLPYNPLYEQGYYSVGCKPCTRAVKSGEDVRAGRWDGLGKVECGLWR